MIKLSDIQKAVANIDRGEVIAKRKARLATLVQKYDVEAVACASGLNITTINQYLRSNYSTIGLEPLTQAETILKSLNKRG